MSSTFFSKKNIRAREILALSYLFFLCAVFAAKLLSGHAAAAALLEETARLLCPPAMIYGAALLLFSEDGTRPDYRRTMLGYAACSYGLFFGIGIVTEKLLHHRALFATVKDLLILTRVPNLCAVFLTLSAAFLLGAFFRPALDALLSRPKAAALAALLGGLCVLIPEGILGYAPFGVLIGGDRLQCIAIAPCLFLILLAGYSVRKETDSSRSGNPGAFTGGAYLLGLAIALVCSRSAGLVLVGAAVSYGLVFASRALLPLYERAEGGVLALCGRLCRGAVRLFGNRGKSRRRNLLTYYAGYCVLFFVMAVLVFLPYLESDTTLIWSVDGLGQYVPKIYRFLSWIPSVLSDLLHGNLDFTQYDFTSGLGSAITVSLDPIYWLYLLFSEDAVETVYSAMIVLRFFLAGISMSAMLLYFKKSHRAALTASMLYTFSGYALYAGTRHGQFLTPLILLPLLVVAMEELISKKKWPLLTVLVALSLLCSYYFLYMNTIALGVYFVTRILCDRQYRNIRTFLDRGFRIVGCYVLGACMGVLSLFTSFAGYMGSSRTQGQDIDSFLSTTPLFYRTEWLSDAFVSFLSDSYTPGMWLKLGFAPLALLAVILVFTRKRRRELRPLFLIGTLFCVIPAAGYVFSGFSSVNNRWCYIYAALIAFIAAEFFDDFTVLKGKELLLMAGLCAFYGCVIFFSTKYRTDMVFAAFGLLAATTAAVFLVNHSGIRLPEYAGKGLLFAVTMLAIVFNANLFITSGSETGTHLDTYVKSGRSLSLMSDTALKYLDEAVGDADEGFYRSTNLKTSGNTRSSSLIYGYNDLSTFTSTLGSGIVDYNSAMGNCDWNIVSIYDYNFRTILNGLACVRYLGTDSESSVPLPYGYEKIYEKETKKKTYEIYENQYALPLGYTYDTVMSAADAQDYSAAEKQELTLQAAIVDEADADKNENLNELTKDSVSLSARRIEIDDMKLKGVTEKDGKLYIEGAGSKITFTFRGDANAETYLSLTGDLTAEKDAKEHFLKTNVKADGVKYLYKFRIDSYSTGQEEYLFNLGYHEDALTTCTLTFKSDGILAYSDIAVYSQPMDAYPSQIAALSENVLENVTTGKNTVTGTIRTTEDKMLVIALPCQSGWTAFVDGEETEIQKVNYQYMGINLAAGEHEIRLSYRTPGLSYAFLITGGGVVVFLGLLLLGCVRKRRAKNTKSGQL